MYVVVVATNEDGSLSANQTGCARAPLFPFLDDEIREPAGWLGFNQGLITLIRDRRLVKIRNAQVEYP